MGRAAKLQSLFETAMTDFTEQLHLMLSSLSLVNTVDIARKYGYVDIRERLADIAGFVHFVDLHADAAKMALTCEWKDYEDAIQYMSAVREGADCIVTRNKKDFQKSSIPVYTIDELLDIYNSTL